MKPDLYTKIILTVIAAALLGICAEDIVNPHEAKAQGPVRVVISDIDPLAASKFAATAGPVPVTLVGGSKYPRLQVDGDNPLAVIVTNK